MNFSLDRLDATTKSLFHLTIANSQACFDMNFHSDLLLSNPQAPSDHKFLPILCVRVPNGE